MSHPKEFNEQIALASLREKNLGLNLVELSKIRSENHTLKNEIANLKSSLAYALAKIEELASTSHVADLTA